MTFTQDDLAPLKEALLTGATSISTNGRTVTFRSQAELRTLIDEIEKSIAATENPSTVNPNKVTATFTK